jgi:hypothetical protein
MGFHTPGFTRDNRPKIQNLPLIHELTSQNIQGGLPGEHYHLTAALYTRLIALASAGGTLVIEPAMSLTGEIMRFATGDIAMLTTLIQEFDPVIGSPVPAPTPPPDVVTPPAPVPAPSPSSPSDPYWNQTVLLSWMELADASPNPLIGWHTEDQYASSIKPIAGAAVLYGTNAVKVWGFNTSHHTVPPAALGDYKWVTGSPKQAGFAEALLNADFTAEGWLYLQAAGLGLARFIIGSVTQGFEIKYDETAGGFTFSKITGGSAIPGSLHAGTMAVNTPIYFCIERKAGVAYASLGGVVFDNASASFICSGMTLWSHGYGPMRVTKGVARYNGANFTPTKWILG